MLTKKKRFTCSRAEKVSILENLIFRVETSNPYWSINTTIVEDQWMLRTLEGIPKCSLVPFIESWFKGYALTHLDYQDIEAILLRIRENIGKEVVEEELLNDDAFCY